MSYQPQQPLSPQASASALLARGGATAALYGPSLSRSRPSDQEAIERAQQQYDQQLAQQEAMLAEQQRGHMAAQWEAGQRQQRGAEGRTAFYNTQSGEALIRQARADLSATSPTRQQQQQSQRSPMAAAAAASSSSVLSSVQDNLQRAHHAECVLPQNIATGVPQQRAEFTPYPLLEWNRFDLKSRQWTGPDVTTQARLKPAAYKARHTPLDVPRRHDLVKSLKANVSTNNHDHNRAFVAKHTNNLFSC